MLKNIAPIILFFSLALLFLWVSAVSAQIPGITGNLTIDITPTIPGPNQGVTIEIESFVTDLNRAKISWLLGGRIKKQGTGAKSFQFTTGPSGSTSRVTIIVNTQERQRIEKQLVFRPAEVDILWEAHTYTPPFYGGKALPTSKSLITFVAQSHFVTSAGQEINPDNLIYTWAQDRRVLGKLSGFGKRSITISGPRLFQNMTILVEVSSFDETYKARKSIFIQAQEPKIVFYEKHPLEGIRYENALARGLLLKEEEITMRAEPYFFSRESLEAGRLDFQWSLNNRSIVTPTLKEIVLRREGKVGGTARVSLEINNLSKILQRAVGTLLINF